ncbi:dienelactone hydrolase family protein [Leptolyngbya sp. FACHB-261]|nr:dienelactone hydrolase family protein [Leptolyngbya sp. FACHB-261]
MPSKFEIRATSVAIQGDGLTIDAYLAQPQVDQALPAIIVFQEIFGVNDYIRDVTRRLACEGYVAIAPALYQRTAPGLELGYGAENIKIGRSYKDRTTAEQLLSDTRATLSYLRNLPEVQPEAIGCIGFCFGGHVAYLAATLADIRATASFYGAGIATMTAGGGAPTVQRTREIQGRIELFLGTQDASIPNEHVEIVEQELQAQNIDHCLHLYDADHGFFCDQRSSYNPAATQDAWQRVKRLFASTFTPDIEPARF